MRLPIALLVPLLIASVPGVAADHPVVVELFTSQGCSSCPPADQVLAALGEEPGGAVIPLAFHVDSWNHLGWMDPFSKREWTLRQQFYARMLGGRGPYTPQAVVDGAHELVGSDERALRAAIARAAAQPAAAVTVAVGGDGESVVVEASVERPAALRGRKLDVMAALYENQLSTAVPRGENGGQTLRDTRVVRLLERAVRLPDDGPDAATARVTLQLGKGWVRQNLGVAVFVQDPKTLTIHGAANAALAAGREEVTRRPLGLAAAFAAFLGGCDSSPSEPRRDAVFVAIADGCPLENGNPQRYRFRTRDAAVIADATARLGDADVIWVVGRFRTGDGGFNAPWNWHHDPADVHLAEITAEGCQGCPRLVSQDLDYWTRFGQYCAPARIVAREG